MEVEWRLFEEGRELHAYEKNADGDSFPICGTHFPWYAQKKHTSAPSYRKAHCRGCWRKVHPLINWKKRALAAEATLAKMGIVNPSS